MGEVRYSLNGKYFRDFGVYVSDSKGIADALKRKPVNKYDWAEYHGISVDLEKPKFQERQIELKCFIKGNNWQDLFDKFNSMIRDEFAKGGTQRLLIEPLGFKALPYEVFLMDDVNLDKTFKDGEMIATFSIKMVEPNPIKKVLYLTGQRLWLSYNCPSETEIFYGNGLKEIGKGNVAIGDKQLNPRYVSGYSFHGRNLVKKSIIEVNTNNMWIEDFHLSEKLEIGEKYTVMIGAIIQNPNTYFYINDEVGNMLTTVDYLGDSRFAKTFTATQNVDKLILFQYPNAGNWVHFYWISVKKGEDYSEWTPAPQDEKFIVIAGNVEEITNLTTNAEVLWEKL